MAAHRFRFFRAGGVDQVELKTGQSLVHLRELDQKLWVALSCPVHGLNLEERTLALLDRDGDGRVRAAELLLAIDWAASCLSDVEELARAPLPLRLASIDETCEDGKLIAQAARRLLRVIGKPDAVTIGVAEVADALTAFDHQADNGDGILPVGAVSDPDLARATEAILSGLPEPKVDRSGAPGITREDVVAFFAAGEARLTFEQGSQAPERALLGAGTAEILTESLQVIAKADDFLTRVRAVEFDGRALLAMNRDDGVYAPIGAAGLSAGADEFAELPWAQVTPGARLPLVSGLNPAWSSAVARFRSRVVVPLLGDRSELTVDEWARLKELLRAEVEWLAQRPTSAWDAVASCDFQEWLSAGAQQRLLDRIEQDESAAADGEAIDRVEKLVRFQRDLLAIANNFVSFRSFYERGGRGGFQVGRLFIDQRELHLVLRVQDVARHALAGPLSGCFLLYCEVRNAKGEKHNVVAAVTDGDVDQLVVGRNAVFYDNQGVDWDATVTRVVENPISVRAAFWSPYKKLVRLIETQIEKRASQADAEADAAMTQRADGIDKAAQGTVDAPASTPKKLDIGVVAALGVAVGGLTAALGVFVEAFLGLGIWMPLGLLALLLMISGPSMAVAALKLRRRNLGPLLDANGWAINVLPRINLPLGQSLTKLARLPKGASRDYSDPFAEKKRPVWSTLLVLLLILLGLLWLTGKLDRRLPERYRASLVLGQPLDAGPATQMPSASTPAAPAPSSPKVPQ